MSDTQNVGNEQEEHLNTSEISENQQNENIEELNSDNNEETIDNERDVLTKLNEELQDTQNKYLRLVAEFDNFRKRNAKERNELIKNASEDIIKSLLEVVDDGDRAMQQIEKTDDINQIKDGVSLVFNKLKSILTQRGLQEMITVGEEFDADKHEAIAEVPTGNDKDAGKVIDEVSKGYTLNDKIIRHAKVVVGK